jgi:ABC-2 type transport system permease protein
MGPLIGVHPNGTLLGPGDPLRDPAVIPLGIGIALITAVILTLITALWFNKSIPVIN